MRRTMHATIHATMHAALHATGLLIVMFALTTFAKADSTASAKPHKAKTGNLTLTSSTEVGGTLLPAGEYRVKEVCSPEGAVMEFTRTDANELASELLSPYAEEVVAQVKFTPEDLGAAQKHTRLLLAEDGKNATALEIRGDNVDYVFDPSTQMAASQSTSMVCTNEGLRK